MKAKTHWLAQVEAVLLADTGDLRKLAEIGGEDPRTLYIGTSMDGVDLRGQDLRGMAFTRLDPAKVRIDADTRLDPAPGSEPETLIPDPEDDLTDTDGMVLFMEHRLIPEFLRSAPRRAPNLAIYGPGEVEAFNHDALRYAGPKFVVFDVRRRAFLERFVGRVPEGVVILLARRTPGFEVAELDRDTAAAARSPIVVIQASSSGTPVYRTATVAVVKDAISVLATNWEVLEKVLRRQRVSVFLRSRGQAPEVLADAWSQMFERTQRMELRGYAGTRLVSAQSVTYADRALDISDALFSGLRPLTIDRRSGPKTVDAAILVDTSRPPNLDYEDTFEGGVERLLSIRRWSMDEFKKPDWPNATEFHLVGRTRSFTMHVVSSATPLLPEIYPSEHLRDLYLNGISTLVVSNDVNESQVVTHLIEKGEFWVNVRDICTFSPDDDTIWSLLQRQLRRLARVPSGPARSQYLSLFLRAALQSEGVLGGDPGRIVDALNQSLFSRLFNVSFGKVAFRPEGAIYQVKIHRAGQPPSAPPVTGFRLEIDGQGPRIHSIVNPLETAHWAARTTA